MTAVYINRIGTAVPPYDVNERFNVFAPSLLTEGVKRQVFQRVAKRGRIDHRYSFLEPGTDPACFDTGEFYRRGRFPDTGQRMRFFERHAPELAAAALEQIGLDSYASEVTHLIVACCTGFYAPGLDLDIIRRFSLRKTVERTIVGFMGCYAAISALKLARHIVRSDRGAKVVVVNLELCTIHLQETQELEQILCFSLWGDGCAASLVSAEPSGIELRSFHATDIPDTADLMTWRMGAQGFDMLLSGSVASMLGRTLDGHIGAILGGRKITDVALWAIHPGGRSILDAVGAAIELAAEDLAFSRGVLRAFGNISSATIMFVLKAMLEGGRKGLGCGMAFGPGLVAETMMFELEPATRGRPP